MADTNAYEAILVDRPRPHIQRVTLNRPDKRNALNNTLRTEILDDFAGRRQVLLRGL